MRLLRIQNSAAVDFKSLDVFHWKSGSFDFLAFLSFYYNQAFKLVQSYILGDSVVEVQYFNVVSQQDTYKFSWLEEKLCFEYKRNHSLDKFLFFELN